MTTTEAVKNGAGTLVESAAGAVSDLAEKARSQAESVKSKAEEKLADKISERKESHRGRTLLIGAALIGAVAAALRYLRRGAGHEERVIDLTRDPVVAPETLPTT